LKTAVIHQPDFLPYLGFFQRLLRADIFIVLDHVQFVHSNRGWTHRDRIKTAYGERWLTVSVKKAPRDTAINKIELSGGDWREQNLNLIRENYRNAPYFSELYPRIEALYASPVTLLWEFNMNSIKLLLEWFAIDLPIIFASTLQPEGHKNELLVDLLKKAGADRYLSGTGAKDYFVPEPFLNAAIEVEWQEFQHPAYPQQFGDFIPYLSSIDLLFNCGAEHARQLLRNS
jgi:hypothetical protein